MEIEIQGLKEAVDMLDKLPKTLVIRGFQRSLQAGANVIGAALAKRTPVKEGKLLSKLRTKVIVDSNGRGGVANIDFGSENHKAAWVEYGHRMVGHKPGKRQIGEVQPHPFIRPAFLESADGAVRAFTAELEEVVSEEYGSGQGKVA